MGQGGVQWCTTGIVHHLRFALSRRELGGAWLPPCLEELRGLAHWDVDYAVAHLGCLNADELWEAADPSLVADHVKADIVGPTFQVARTNP